MKQVPQKANIAAQEHFRTETPESLVNEAQQGRIELLFMDAAHFVLLPFLGYLYSLATRFIKSSSGRKRFSVLGAINAVSKELIMITEDVAYTGGLYFSPEVFRRLLAPFYRSLINRFCSTRVALGWHSDGDVLPLLPDLVEHLALVLRN